MACKKDLIPVFQRVIKNETVFWNMDDGRCGVVVPD